VAPGLQTVTFYTTAARTLALDSFFIPDCQKCRIIGFRTIEVTQHYAPHVQPAPPPNYPVNFMLTAMP